MNTNPKPRTLNQEKILTSAIEIIEQEGLAKLTMRAIATNLNVQVAAIYNHFNNKQALIIALQSHYLDEQNQCYKINQEASTWEEYLTSIAQSSRLEFTSRPYILELFATHSSDSEQSSIKFEQYLTKMTSFGFSLLHAAQISHTIYTYIVGFCNFENGVKGTANNSKKNFSTLKTVKYPLISEFFSRVDWNLDRDYEFGISTLIDGFRKYCNDNN